MINEITRQIKVRKLGTAHQQNLIELFTYIYFNPGKHTYYSLAEEMNKGKRAIQRMIDDINELYPCIKSNINDSDGKAHLKIQGYFTETLLDKAYQQNKNATLLYVFLKSFIIRPISVYDIMQNLNVDKKQATKIVEKIFDTTPYGDFIGFDEELL